MVIKQSTRRALIAATLVVGLTTGQAVAAAETTPPADTPVAAADAQTDTAAGNPAAPQEDNSQEVTADDESNPNGLEALAATKDDAGLQPNVPDYVYPSLSSPSSSEPGLVWHARGLSSKIIDPIGGYKGLLIGVAVVFMAMTIYENVQVRNGNVTPDGRAVYPPQLEAIKLALDGFSSQVNSLSAPGGSSALSGQLNLPSPAPRG